MKRAYKHIESGNVQILSDLTVEILSSEKIAGKNVWQPLELSEEEIEYSFPLEKLPLPTDQIETPRVSEIKPLTNAKYEGKKAMSSKELD